MKSKIDLTIVCPPDLPVPPFEGYGGVQRSIFDFVGTLVKTGRYRISVLGPGDSKIGKLLDVSLVTGLEQSLWGALVRNQDFTNRSLEEVRLESRENEKKARRYSRFVSDQIKVSRPRIILVFYEDPDLLKELASGELSDRVVYSLRYNINQDRQNLLREIKGITITALTESHRRNCGDVGDIKVIKWGLGLDMYDFSDNHLSRSEEIPNIKILREWRKAEKDYLICIAEIGTHKSQKTAIEIAKRADVPIILAGTPLDKATLKKTEYFKRNVVPMLSDGVIYFGNANEFEKIELLRFAKGCLAPYGYELQEWHEPFGRVIVESMACGTPVVGFNHGSIPELISEGVSGYLFRDVKDAACKVGQLNSLDRYKIRRHVSDNFDIERVVSEYEEIFQKIVS